jgi:hypothetical protein
MGPSPRRGVREPARMLTLGALVAGLFVVACLSASASAVGKAKPLKCPTGTVPARVGAKTTCLSLRLALPAPSNSHPFIAQVEGALGFTQLSFRAHSGKRVRSFAQQFGRSWTTTRARLLVALSGIIAREQQTAVRPAAVTASYGSFQCAVAKALNEAGIDFGSAVKGNSSATIDGVGVTMSIDPSGSHIGFKTTSNGDTFTMNYDSADTTCLAYALPPCPQADGSLNAYGVKGRDGLSLMVTRAGKVLKSEAFTKTITVETRGQVADDAKLDYVDVKYGETSQIVLDGVHETQYGNRTVRIDMRTGAYGPGDSVSFGTAGADGSYANVAGEQASAKDFASFVKTTIKAYQSRQDAWQTPDKCAKITFNPVSNALTVSDGDKGSFSAQITANSDGQPAAKARWTLSAQQNGTFSPTTADGPQSSFDYAVAAQSGTKLSTTVHATSTAGVAEETWWQNLNQINTVSGSFSGHEQDSTGEIFDWSGTATFKRQTGTPTPGAGVFMLVSGRATVTVSGTTPGCGPMSGSGQIDLAPQGLFTLMPGHTYQIATPFVGTEQITATQTCASTTTSFPVAPGGNAIQSGDPLTGGPSALVQQSPDGHTFAGTASTTGALTGDSSNWTWSFTGSP